MSREIVSKLLLDDIVTMEMVEQFLGITGESVKILRYKKYTVIIDLSEDRLYILTKTGRERNGQTLFKIARVYVCTRLIDMLLQRGDL